MVRKVIFGASLGLLLSFSSALAADCVEGLKVVKGAIGDIIQCLILIEKENTELHAKVAELEAGSPRSNAEFPSGAVVAFAKACPTDQGWSEYEHGFGRVIVGAGKPNAKQYQISSYPYWQPGHLPKRNDNRVKLTDYEPEEAGGEERVVIITDEMPEHVHGLGVVNLDDVTARSFEEQAGGVDIPWYLDGSSGLEEGLEETANVIMKNAGGSAPHNNMPPYIALYFCKKD